MGRNQAPHFKVRLSVRNHSKMQDVYTDNRLFAGWVRLGIHAMEAYADRTEDSFIVPDRKLLEIFGVGRVDVARASLLRLADASSMSASREGRVWRITWRNFASKQFPFRNDVPLTGSLPLSAIRLPPPPVRTAVKGELWKPKPGYLWPKEIPPLARNEFSLARRCAMNLGHNGLDIRPALERAIRSVSSRSGPRRGLSFQAFMAEATFAELESEFRRFL